MMEAPMTVPPNAADDFKKILLLIDFMISILILDKLKDTKSKALYQIIY